MKGLRRHLTELAFALMALGAIVPLARHALSTPERGVEAQTARDVVSSDMLSPKYPHNPCTRGRIALTFDDGPDVYTPQVLEVLRAYNVKATFYVMGRKAEERPGLVRAIAADGHRVQNHSWDHPHMADLTPAEIRRQLGYTQRAVMAAGAPRPTVFRPPFGNIDAQVEREAGALGLRVVRWTIDTNDWRGRAPDDIAASALNRLTPGASVLLHDGVANTAATIKALPAIVDGARARGYCTAFDTE